MLEFFLFVLLVEAVTELLVKSEIFLPARKKIKSYSKWLGKLVSCVYCTSFWVAAAALYVLKVPLNITGLVILDYLVCIFLLQRASNILHNVIDKWTDKYFDTRYINTDRE